MICLFMVIQKSMMKYITRMGQNTGTLNASKNVQTMATRMPLVAACLEGRGEGQVRQLHSVCPHGASWPCEPGMCNVLCATTNSMLSPLKAVFF